LPKNFKFLKTPLEIKAENSGKYIPTMLAIPAIIPITVID
jgi:hypothetical protein